MYTITREVSETFAHCQLTHLDRSPIDVARARSQHAAYVTALGAVGCTVVTLPEAPELPDAVFVEDTAVVVEEIAVLTRPGAEPRRAEVASMARALAPLRELRELTAPAILDGGDVLRLDRQLFAGLSARTNEAGVSQLARHLEPYGYVVHGVPLGACLHLKTAVTEAAWSETDGSTILVNPAWFDPRLLGEVTVIEVDPSEPFAANCLRVDDRVIYPAAFPRTRERLEAHGIEVVPVEVDELAKAEGAVTCCSILVR